MVGLVRGRSGVVVGVEALLWQQAGTSMVCLFNRNRIVSTVLRISADLWFQVSLLTFGSRFPCCGLNGVVMITADLRFQISLLTVGSSSLCRVLA